MRLKCGCGPVLEPRQRPNARQTEVKSPMMVLGCNSALNQSRQECDKKGGSLQKPGYSAEITEAPRTTLARAPLQPSKLRIMRSLASLLSSSTHVLRSLFLVLATFVLSAESYAGQILVLRATTSAPEPQQSLALAASFYGLTLQTVTITSDSSPISIETSILRAQKENSTVAWAVQAEALPLIDEKQILKTAKDLPILLFGITPTTDIHALSAWTGGSITNIASLESSTPHTYVIGRIPTVTAQLSGAEINFRAGSGCSFDFAGSGDTDRLASMKEGQHERAVALRFNTGKNRIFASCELLSSNEKEASWGPAEILNAFPSIAADLMFVRYSAGERGWHAAAHYANFTIDDAWLHQPYGYLDYQGLLAEMERHNFHTTIAFIPWNFDRSEPGVVSLIRQHADRYSICVHGDNHDHKEFTTEQGKPLAVQVFALKQALARMDRFQALTGIPYDKVMVFPHSIGGEGVLAGLKEYNYLATTNSTNVPMDRPSPDGLSFALRPVTMSYGNFPSLTRYSAEVSVSPSLIAVAAFLENPLLFYGHHGMFAQGIGAFDGVADEVNTISPGIQWRSLGEIARHLYLVKLRDDGNYDLRAFTSTFVVENISGSDRTYYIQKQENGQPAIRELEVDGRPYPHSIQGQQLTMELSVPAGQARTVAIQYANDSISAPADISKDSALVYSLRMASDFRDLVLPRIPLGHQLVLYYYAHDMTPMQFCGYGAALFGAGLLAAVGLRRRVARSARVPAAGVSHVIR